MNIMLTSLLNISVICTSLFAWVILTINGFILLRYHRKDPKAQLICIITFILWLVTSFNAWYEGFFLFKRLSLLSSINSWTYVLLTPLFYLFYRYCITSQYPDLRKWIQHLLLPGILLTVYAGISLFNPVQDRFIYSWNELLSYRNSWWIVFRVTCYVSLAIQLIFYLPRLFGNCINTPKAMRIRKEMKYILCFCFLSVLTMLLPFQTAALIYYLAVTALSFYLFKLSPSYRLFKQKISLYFIPQYILPKNEKKGEMKEKISSPIPPKKEESYILFTPDEEARVIEKINSPKLLHNPYLSISMLARELSTNQTYLSRYFNRQLGMSFPEYVSSHRLIKAEKLLKETDITIIEISEQVGFQSVSSFYQAFNARHKMTPSQWRKEHMKSS